MKPKIGKPLFFLSIAKEIWDSVAHTYSNKGHVAQVYEFKIKIHETKQEDLSITISC